MAFKGDQYIWKDRKRFLGMPLSFTRYALSDDRLFLSKGCLNVSDDELLLYRVRDISVKRTFGQRLCGVGTVTIVSSDKSTPALTLLNIKKPMDFKELLHASVEDCKLKRRVRINEMLDGGPNGDFDDDDILDDDFNDDTP